jgi:hypothetical protein
MAHLTPRLAGIDAVVNCVGILQGSLRDDAERILRRRSAVSAETGVPTAYAQSTAKADAALARLDANWLIVRLDRPRCLWRHRFDASACRIALRPAAAGRGTRARSSRRLRPQPNLDLGKPRTLPADRRLLASCRRVADKNARPRRCGGCGGQRSSGRLLPAVADLVLARLAAFLCLIRSSGDCQAGIEKPGLAFSTRPSFHHAKCVDKTCYWLMSFSPTISCCSSSVW